MSGEALGSISGKLIAPLTKIATKILCYVCNWCWCSKQKIHGSGTTVILSNEGINDIIKIVKALEESDILLKGVTGTLKNDVKRWCFTNFNNDIKYSTLGSSLIGNLLTWKGLDLVDLVEKGYID